MEKVKSNLKEKELSDGKNKDESNSERERSKTKTELELEAAQLQAEEERKKAIQLREELQALKKSITRKQSIGSITGGTSASHQIHILFIRPPFVSALSIHRARRHYVMSSNFSHLFQTYC